MCERAGGMVVVGHGGKGDWIPSCTCFHGSLHTPLPLMCACLVQHGGILLGTVLVGEVVSRVSISLHEGFDGPADRNPERKTNKIGTS